MQCGYCIPAMILSAKAYLDERHAQAGRGRGAGGAVGQPVPLHRIPEDRRGRDRRGAAAQLLARRDAEDAMSGQERRVVGKRLQPHRRHRQGHRQAVYAADFALPGMLYGKVLRSTRAARPHQAAGRRRRRWRCPACAAVLTAPRHAADPLRHRHQGRHDVRRGRGPLSRPADRRGRRDQVSRSPRRRCGAIEVEYEPLPAVFDLEAALAPGAPLVHAGWSDYQALPVFEREGNVCGRRAHRRRRRRGGLWRSPTASSSTASRPQHVHPGYTEPRAAVASWDGNGDVTVW